MTELFTYKRLLSRSCIRAGAPDRGALVGRAPVVPSAPCTSPPRRPRARRRRHARRGLDERHARGIEDEADIDFRRARTSSGPRRARSWPRRWRPGARRTSGADGAAPRRRLADADPAPSGTAAALRASSARLGGRCHGAVRPGRAGVGDAPAARIVRAARCAAAPAPSARSRGLARPVDALGVRFDGRLRIVGVDRRSGRRVVFGAPGAPRRTSARRSQASCAIPWVFAPGRDRRARVRRRRRLEPRTSTPPPPAAMTEVLCLQPTGRSAAARRLGACARPHAAALAEMLALRARGARVRTSRPTPRRPRRWART